MPESTQTEAVRITQLGAAELARRISDRSISSVEAVEAFIARLEALQPRLNMVTRDRFDKARKEAQTADSRRESDEALPPLLGVPITVKECFDVRGLATSLGVTGRTEQPAARDARLVSKLRDAGAIVLAKSNIPQLGLYLESDNPQFGRTMNPWDETRTCGGSSGGEAVIAAIGGSALGVGSDLGGSIRVPAHFCGVHAFKPTSGLLSTEGIEFALAGMNSIPNVPGFFGPTVEDLVVALRVGQEEPVPFDKRYGPRLGDDLTGTRFVQIVDDDFFPVAPAIRRVVQEAAGHLQACGADLVSLALPDLGKLMERFAGLLAADGGVGVKRQLLGSAVDVRIQALLRMSMFPSVLRRPAAAALRSQKRHHAALLLGAAKKRSTDEYWQLNVEVAEWRQSFLSQWHATNANLLLVPPCAMVAFPHGSSNDLATAAIYSILFNVLDMPAGVVAASRVRHGEESSRDPVADLTGGLATRSEHGSAGLPVGIQVVGSPFHDRQVLGAMSVLERFFGRREESPMNPLAKEKWQP